MGAKQSKRSVDISGKEAEGAGEVAAAGAGGEGRVEQLADADALKPQLNGDAHIHEPTDKEKQLDSGTPENEKDATTEKEGKEQEEEKEKESSPVTNGDAEQKEENVETTPSPDDGKKPKKEKVKKKWSLRSISFSRKDKPKQEKKQKEDEPKTNGEPEKVPEEIAETPDVEKIDVVPEDKAETEAKEEKTPETPVTEPITNGSSTPETPKEESLAADEPTTPDTKENDRPEAPKEEVAPEPVPVNGLSVEEPKNEIPAPVESETSKPEEPTIEKTEPVPATEIPVKNEVCVEKMPLIEPTPPPLPANPPPSSVVSFAATTMAPELTDASLANTADITSNTPCTETSEIITEKNKTEEISPAVDIESVANIKNTEAEPVKTIPQLAEPLNEKLSSNSSSDCQETAANDTPQDEPLKNVTQSENPLILGSDIVNDVPNGTQENQEVTDTELDNQSQTENSSVKQIDIEKQSENEEIVSENNDIVENSDTVPENAISDSNVDDTITKNDDTEKENLLKKSKISSDNVEIIETKDDVRVLVNGDSNSLDDTTESAKPIVTPEDSMPPSLSEVESLAQAAAAEANGDADDASNDASDASNDASKSFPPPPGELSLSESQEVLSTSDKMKELIPEVPTIPELKTEMETPADVAAN